MDPKFIEKEESQQTTSSRSSPNDSQLENAESGPICSNTELDSTEYSEMKTICPIMLLPTEIITKVFEYIPAEDLSTNVRLVNHRFKSIAENCLNFKFGNLNLKLTSLIDQTTLVLKERRDDIELICLCKLLNFAEILRSENNIITATIWRYAFNDFFGSTKSCMYGGLILDEQERFIRTFEEEPYKLYSIPTLQMLPEQIKCIMAMTREFCCHFDQVTEASLNNCEILSGCKTIDMLDTIIYNMKIISYEIVTATRLKAKYTYYLKHSWFIALPFNGESQERSPRQRQQFMHMCLRRLTRAHNYMYLNDSHCRQDFHFQITHPYSIQPKSNIYSGFGEIGPWLFNYGVMNGSAYNHNFSSLHNHIFQEGDYEFIFNEPDNPQVGDENESSEENNIPPLGVEIEVILNVPLSYAPRQYLLERMEEEKRTALVHKQRRQGQKTEATGKNSWTSIVIRFECKGARNARLPEVSEYCYELNAI